MPAPIISLDTHRKLVDAFRAAPGELSRAAKVAGVSFVTARRYWLFGHTEAKDIRKTPIHIILREEDEAARARMAQLQEETERLTAELEARRRADAHALAIKDATDSRVQEGQLVRVARSSATGILVTLAKLSQATAKLGGRVAKSIEAMAAEEAPMTPDEMHDTVQTLARLTQALKQANDAGKQVMEMERLLLGDPNAVVHHVHHHLHDVTVDEAEARIKAGLRALERAKQKGLVVDGHVMPGPGDTAVALPPRPSTAPEDAEANAVVAATPFS